MEMDRNDGDPQSLTPPDSALFPQITAIEH
jgi:hypothetical protein